MSGRRRGRPAKKNNRNVKEAQVQEGGNESMEVSPERKTKMQGEEVVKFPNLERSGNSRKEEQGIPESECTDTDGENEVEYVREKEETPRKSAQSIQPSPKWCDLDKEEARNPLSKGKEKGLRFNTPQKSWSQVVQGDDGSIKYMTPIEVKGTRMGELEMKEVEESKGYWGNVLVCKVIGGAVHIS